MNLITLREKVKRRTGGGLGLANSAIIADLNEGYFALVGKIAQINEDYFEAPKTRFDLFANSSKYALPTDLIKFKQLRIAYTTPTSESDYRVASPYDPSSVYDISSDEISATMANPIFDITNNNFRIYPKPKTDVPDGGELYYIAMPSAMTLTSDVPLIPTQFRPLISDYAAGKELEEKGQHDRADRIMARFEKDVEEMLIQLKTRNINNNIRFNNPLEVTRKKDTTELW